MTDDIKELLGKALRGEPPMGLDRDEVLDAGRKRLRRRRSFAASGVAAAVVVAAVGAATLTGLIDVDPTEKMPPAASRTATTTPPPGLDLPLPETPRDPPSASTSEGSPAKPSQADQLTQRLYSSGLLSADSAKPPGKNEGTAEFEAKGDLYHFEADIIPAIHPGSLQITVEQDRPGRVANCSDIARPFGDCHMQLHEDITVVFGIWKNTDGERRTLAVTVLPSGVRVAAISSNMTLQQQKMGASPAFAEPALDQGELAKLIVLTNFHAS